MAASQPVLVKKYSNRRLYDTELSRYVTLEELTSRIRSGVDLRVVDASSGEDLTQATLLQVILDSKASRLLPATVLARLVRLQDDALAEFFGRYVAGALDLYLAAKQGAQAVAPAFPLATLPWTAGNAMARLLGQGPPGQQGWAEALAALAGQSPYGAAPYAQAGYGGGPPTPYGPMVPPPPPPAPAAAVSGDVAAMRDELGAMRRELAALRDAPHPVAPHAAASPRKAAKKAAARAPASRGRTRRGDGS